MSENPFFELVGAPQYSHGAQNSRAAAEFESFSQKHKKQYSNDVDLGKRKANFNHNLRCVHYMKCKQITCFTRYMI